MTPLVSGSEDIPTDCAEAMSKLVMTSEKGSVGRLSHDFRLRNQRDVEFTLAVFDSEGNRFHNFSSLAVQWTSSDPVRGFFYSVYSPIVCYFVRPLAHGRIRRT